MGTAAIKSTSKAGCLHEPHLQHSPSCAFLAFRSYNRKHMNRMIRVLCSILVAVPLLSRAQAPAPSETVPVIQGGVGRCSLDLTVLGADGKPVYAATVRVHVKYGFGGMRRLDQIGRA